MENTNVYTTQTQRFNLLPCSVVDFRGFNTYKLFGKQFTVCCFFHIHICLSNDDERPARA